MAVGGVEVYCLFQYPPPNTHTLFPCYWMGVGVKIGIDGTEAGGRPRGGPAAAALRTGGQASGPCAAQCSAGAAVL